MAKPDPGKHEQRGDDDRRRDQLSDIAREVGDAIGEVSEAVGGAVGELMAAVSGSLARRNRETAEQRLVRRADKKRRDWLGHRNSYIAVNAGLVGLNVALGVIVQQFDPWFLFPLLGWGIGLSIHGLSYRSWLADNAQPLANARALLAAQPAQPPDETVVPADVARDSQWAALLERCQRAAATATASLQAADWEPELTDQLRTRLQQGTTQLEQLARGAVALKQTAASIEPDGPDGLQARIAALQARIDTTDDAGLRAIHQANRNLLAARADKLAAMRSEQDRMLARAEGFLLAVENVQLDASRLRGSGIASLDTLTEPLNDLAAEVRIMQQVQAELADLDG